jgi:hypothetical protein
MSDKLGAVDEVTDGAEDTGIVRGESDECHTDGDNAERSTNKGKRPHKPNLVRNRGRRDLEGRIGRRCHLLALFLLRVGLVQLCWILFFLSLQRI